MSPDYNDRSGEGEKKYCPKFINLPEWANFHVLTQQICPCRSTTTKSGQTGVDWELGSYDHDLFGHVCNCLDVRWEALTVSRLNKSLVAAALRNYSNIN